MILLSSSTRSSNHKHRFVVGRQSVHSQMDVCTRHAVVKSGSQVLSHHRSEFHTEPIPTFITIIFSEISINKTNPLFWHTLPAGSTCRNLRVCVINFGGGNTVVAAVSTLDSAESWLSAAKCSRHLLILETHHALLYLHPETRLPLHPFCKSHSCLSFLR